MSKDFENFKMTLRRIEKKWQEKWRKQEVFDAKPEPNKRKYFITVPYPYASGPLHIGHGRTYTTGDVIARYKRMKGYNVLFPMAFHITGTPIEGISARIRAGDEESIKRNRYYISLYEDDPETVDRILKSFENPRNVANYFSSVISSDFDALGFSITWKRRFTTGDPEYNAFITWQFKRLYELGHITTGTYPILYCLKEENAVGEDDILGGDEIKPEVMEYVGIKFKLNDNLYLVAATLRPETIFGVTNLWINPEGQYTLARVNGERWIISKDSIIKIERQGYKVEVVEEFSGWKLIGKYTDVPGSDRKVPILPGLFVDTDEATGVVYSVPAHAPYDYAALVDIKRNPGEYGVKKEIVEMLEPIPIIRIEGYGIYPAKDACEKYGVKSQLEKDKLEKATEQVYKDEYYSGVLTVGPFKDWRVSDVKPKVVEWLEGMDRAVKIYEVSALKKPVVCRCGGKVIVAVLENQWFIDYSREDWKNKAREALRNMTIIPEAYRRLFEDTIKWLDKRPCARRRGIGTPLPMDERWIIESLSDSTIYMAFYTVIHRIRGRIPPEKLSPSFWDYAFLGKGDVERIAEEVGVTVKELEEIRNEFEYWYPVDQRHTAIPHITNHLTFFIFHHVALFPREKWPKTITLNELVIREGSKMSKSKGNVIPLVEVPRRYSADWYRLYIISQADLNTVTDWREKNVMTVGKKLRRFWQIMQFEGNKNSSKNVLDRWIISRVNRMIEKVTECYERFKLREAVVEAFFNMLNDVEAYLKYGSANVDTFSYIKDRWIRVMAPVIPHIAEEIWEKLGNKSFISLENWPEPETELIDGNVEKAYATVLQVVEDANQILNVIKGEKPKKLYVYVASAWKYDALEKLKVERPVTLGKLMGQLKDYLRKYGREAETIAKEVARREGKWPYSTREAEVEMLKTLRQMIIDRTGVEDVKIVEEEKATYDPMGKAARALPGKPALYLE